MSVLPSPLAINYDPSDDNHVTRLSDSTKKSLCKLQNKKKLLGQVLHLKGELLVLADDNDSAQPTNLKEQLENIFGTNIKSKNVIQSQNNAQLSSSVVSLFDIMEVLGERAKERQGTAGTCFFRK